MKKCVFAGTFDPLTKGHAFVIEKCATLFDQVVIAIGVNVDKNPMFSLADRKKMIENTFKGVENISVQTFSGMLVDFMKQNDIAVNVRGIRDADDYKYELTMERFNRDMYSDMTTLFVPTPKELVHVSSSAIRSIIDLKGSIEEYVPKAVCDYISALKTK